MDLKTHTAYCENVITDNHSYAAKWLDGGGQLAGKSDGIVKSFKTLNADILTDFPDAKPGDSIKIATAYKGSTYDAKILSMEGEILQQETANVESRDDGRKLGLEFFQKHDPEYRRETPLPRVGIVRRGGITVTVGSAQK